MQASAVPVFQQFAREIGERRMQSYLEKFAYGNASVEGGIDRFWLDGGLRPRRDCAGESRPRATHGVSVDLIVAFEFLPGDVDFSGVYNGTTPNAVSNKQ